MAAHRVGRLEAPQSDLIIKVKGIDDRDAANLLTNREIMVDSEQLPPLEVTITTGKT